MEESTWDDRSRLRASKRRRARTNEVNERLDVKHAEKAACGGWIRMRVERARGTGASAWQSVLKKE